MEDFIGFIAVGEERGVFYVRIGSIYFSVFRYFLLFVGKCLIGRGKVGLFSFLDFAVLREVFYNDKIYSLGIIVV